MENLAACRASRLADPCNRTGRTGGSAASTVRVCVCVCVCALLRLLFSFPPSSLLPSFPSVLPPGPEFLARICCYICLVGLALGYLACDNSVLHVSCGPEPGLVGSDLLPHLSRGPGLYFFIIFFCRHCARFYSLILSALHVRTPSNREHRTTTISNPYVVVPAINFHDKCSVEIPL